LRIPEDKIAEVRDRTDIVQIIGEVVALRRAGGANWKGLCPFHDERTPSFNVNQTMQIFHCFGGCGKKGNVFQFMIEFHRMDFVEAVRELAKRAGVDLPEPSPEAARAADEQRSERDRLLRVNEIACAFFQAELAGPRGARARAYLEQRGTSREIADAFRLGYAPDGWDHLQKHLLGQKVSLALAEKVGLVGTSERGRKYDFFRDRVMLPVLGRSGDVVGFGSRLLDPDAKERKYVNSPESPVYHKKDQLYGLHAARDAIRKSGRVVIVEGNFDVISLHQAGVGETVAPMGTALGPDQVDLLRRFARTLVLLFDGDTAGRKATREAIFLCAKAGADARVVALPRLDGKKIDPDDFVRREGGDALRAILGKAQPAIEYFLDDVAAQAEKNVPGRIAAIAEAKSLLVLVADPAARELYARHLAERLGVETRHVLQALRGGVAVLVQNSAAKVADAPKGRKPAPEEIKLLALLLAEASLTGQAEESHAGDLFADADLARLYRMIVNQVSERGRADAGAVLEGAPPDLVAPLGKALAEDLPTTPQAVRDCTNRMRARSLEGEYRRLQDEYKQAHDPELWARVVALRNQLEALKGDRG
jgi:DNA primase